MSSLFHDMKSLGRRSRAFVERHQKSRVAEHAEQAANVPVNSTPAVHSSSTASTKPSNNSRIHSLGVDSIHSDIDTACETTVPVNPATSGKYPVTPPKQQYGASSHTITVNTPVDGHNQLVGTDPQRMSTSSRPIGPFTPRVLSIADNSWVHQKVLLIYGRIGEEKQKPQDGEVTLHHHPESFPSTKWPVNDLHFKILAVLQPGLNKLRIDYILPGSTGNGPSSTFSTDFCINYMPLNDAPPLHLAIMVAKDSKLQYDATPARTKSEGNGLQKAIAKFRMSAYLWQAFTAEQMYRQGLGRRTFRFDEELVDGTLSSQDRDFGLKRHEPVVHVIKMKKTLKELRDPDVAQQYEPAKRKGDLYAWVDEALKDFFKPKNNQKIYVSCLLLDSHWDTKLKTVTAHAALGGANDPVHFGIFGSHALQSYPSCIEEVVPAFTDTTKTDTKYVANDAGESGSVWEACNIGIGAHLHETGHALGCPHQEHGVMLRDYVTFNRTFTTREPYSTRTKSKGQRLVLPRDECSWHRLDCLRFRFHPCFRLRNDTVPPHGNVQVWVMDQKRAIITAVSGIAFIEIYAEGDDLCRAWLDFSADTAQPKQLPIIESELRARLPRDKQKKKLKIVIHTVGQGCNDIGDVTAMLNKVVLVNMPDNRLGFKGPKLGNSPQRPSTSYEIKLRTAIQPYQVLVAIRVFSGSALDGLEFIYEDKTSQMFGKKGGSPTLFELDHKRKETLAGFFVRAGAWIDGLQILTSSGRSSQMFGNANGGRGHTLVPPNGYMIAGVYGTAGQWADGFGLIIRQ